MPNEVLLYIGSIIVTVWGIGHIIPTRNVVEGFGDISKDNERIITMEWIAEGITQIFSGIFVATFVYVLGVADQGTAVAVYLTSGLLACLAIVSSLTGARTSQLPFRMCPFVLSTVIILFLAGIMT